MAAPIGIGRGLQLDPGEARFGLALNTGHPRHGQARRVHAIQPRGEEFIAHLHIGVGCNETQLHARIVGAIANEAGLNGRSIGRIQIFDAHSLVDLPQGMPEEVFKGLQRLRVMNRELQISRVRD